MAPRSKKGVKGKSKGKKRAARRAPRRRMNEVAQASFQTLSIGLLPNQAYAARNFSLSNSTRAVQVAQAYQFYRIRKVTAYIRPFYDTYSPGTGTNATVPHLYMVIDKDGSFPANTTLQTLKAAGARPIRLDDRIIKRSFVPRTLEATVVSPTTSAGPTQYGLGVGKSSPWLPTNKNAYDEDPASVWAANSVDHLGVLFAVDCDQITTPIASPICNVSFEIEYEFKKALWTSAQGDTAMSHIDLDTMTVVVPEVPLKV